MARKTVLVSDLSGAEIPEGKGAQVTIKFNDARKGREGESRMEKLVIVRH